MELNREIPDAIVPALPGGPHFALFGMSSTAVKKCATQGAILPPVLAGGTWGANRQTQAIRKTDLEVLVWHELWGHVLKEDRSLQKPTRARTSSRPQIHLVVLSEAVAQSLGPLLLQFG